MASSTMRPNILLLMADQQKATSLPQYGNPDVRAPALTELAKRGVLAETCYVQHPFCLPSRASLITGRYPQATRVHFNGHTIPADEVLLPELLRDAGYRTGAIGHLHGHENMGRGCDYVYDLAEGAQGARLGVHRSMVRAAPRRVAHMVGSTSVAPDDEVDGLMTTAAIEFLAAAAREPAQPFFLHVGWIAPHPPYFACAPYDTMYDPAAVHLPPAEPRDGRKPAQYRETAREMGTLDAPEREIRAAMAHYYGMCTYVDDQIGRLWETLKRTGQDRNTLIVYTSDHGDYVGEHQMFGKSCTLYDCLTRVPFVLSGPDTLVPQGVRLDGLVEAVDIVPTLLDLIGLEVPSRVELHGQSLRGLWEAPGAGSGEGGEYEVEGFNVAFSEVGSHRPDQVRDTKVGFNVPNGPPASGRQTELSTMIRTREWKYIHTPGRERQELYYMANDPWELHNLYGTGGHEALVAGFRERLLDWQLRYR